MNWERKALWAAVLANDKDDGLKLALADHYDEAGEVKMARALRWCVEHGKWPNKHSHFVTARMRGRHHLNEWCWWCEVLSDWRPKPENDCFLPDPIGRTIQKQSYGPRGWRGLPVLNRYYNCLAARTIPRLIWRLGEVLAEMQAKTSWLSGH